MMRTTTRLLTTLVCTLLLPALATAQTAYNRYEVPGHYTIGLYADAEGSSRTIELPQGVDTFEAWIGITGDSTKVFSAMVFDIDLPPSVELAGPIRWISIPGLRASGSIHDKGLQVEFNTECQTQRGTRPVMMGRIEMRVDETFREATITPDKHTDFGLSVELCSDERNWPKPFAEGLGITVKRKLSLMDRIRSWFD